MSIIIYEFTHYFEEVIKISGIREKKKELTRKKIIEVSKALFAEKGYKSVKTSEIAELSNIGEGTLFNYFQSKGELFIVTFFENFNYLEYEVNIEKIATEEQITNEIISIINYYLLNLKYIDKKLIQEYYSIIYDTANAESLSTRKSEVNAEIIIMNNLKKFFDTLIHSEILDEIIDIKTAVKCIYACSINVFNEFVYGDVKTYDSMMDIIKNQVKFILNGNIVWKHSKEGAKNEGESIY